MKYTSWNMTGDNTGEKLRQPIKAELLPPRAQQRVRIVEASLYEINSCTQIRERVIAKRYEQQVKEATSYLDQASVDQTSSQSNPAGSNNTGNYSEIKRNNPESSRSAQESPDSETNREIDPDVSLAQNNTATADEMTPAMSDDTTQAAMIRDAYNKLAQIEQEKADVK